MNQRLTALADDLERDRQTLQLELDEIDLLLKQATGEAERNETRRVQAEERLSLLERDRTSDVETVGEARTQLLTQTRRAMLMQAQLEILGGKQRVLERYRERVDATLPVVRSAAQAEPELANGHTGGADASGDVLAAQEQMRREIARQMHDGPAQSIANIALQAEIVQRLFERDPDRAAQQLTELVGMVQQALDATKSFIFDVRPMVLDDLGLVPTLRRSASERSRRSSVPVRFESVGTDGRLSTENESGLFRMVDDAVVALLAAQATAILVRLDWSDHSLRATVQGRSREAEVTAQQRAKATVAAARRDKALPDQLTTLIHQQEEDEASRHAGMPDSVLAEIEQRAASLAMTVKLSEDRWTLELLISR